MEMNDYQSKASTTAVFPKDVGLIYTTLGLVSEAGEVADKVKKVIRDNNGDFSDEVKNNIMKELGDVLWYIAGVASELGFDLETVANTNLEKLASRHNRGKIGGSGDDR